MELHRQYQSFLDLVAHRPGLDSNRLVLEAVYYLLLQDRVALANELLIDRYDDEAAEPFNIYYDYVWSYLQFYLVGPGVIPERALEIAVRHVRSEHITGGMRERFRAIIEQIREISPEIGAVQPVIKCLTHNTRGSAQLPI